MKRVKLFIPACGPMRHRVCMYVCMYVCGCAVLTSCTREDMNDIVSDISVGDGAPVAFNILLQDAPDYGSPELGSPATRSREPLISEWVRASSFSVTRSAEEDSDSWRMALMELYEDSVPARAQTRTVSPMPAGNYFRVMAFEKTGTGPKDYVFRCAADYTSNGSSAPVLRLGNIILPYGKTYRFAAYSFNNIDGLGGLPTAATCKWEDAATAIKIPNLDNDFLTFVSDDIAASSSALNLPVTFTHQLCRLTIKISVTGGKSNTFSNCTGYVKQGGNSSSWQIGAGGIAANTTNSASFSIPDNNQTTFCRLVPNTAASTISVHFGTLTVDGVAADNVDITSSQSVQLLPGKSYTLTAQFENKPGVVVLPGDIDLGGPSCDDPTKEYLSKLCWAKGNLMGTNTDQYYRWDTPTGTGYYYTWNTYYTGNTHVDGNQNPCDKLDPDIYGTGWHVPSKADFDNLIKCASKANPLDVKNGVKGMWFMSRTRGLFLPAAGHRNNFEGSGTTPTSGSGSYGYYWSSAPYGRYMGYYLFVRVGVGVYDYNQEYGVSVRCVKGTKQ